jgi:hypothetical protein
MAEHNGWTPGDKTAYLVAALNETSARTPQYFFIKFQSELSHVQRSDDPEFAILGPVSSPSSCSPRHSCRHSIAVIP